MVPDVTLVLVSPSSWIRIGTLLSRSPFLSPQSVQVSWKRIMERWSPAKAPPNARRRMMPPTPQQISHSSTDESRWQAELEAQSFWSIPERRKRRYKSGDLGVGAADGSRRLRSLSEIYPGACKKKRQQDLRYFQHKRILTPWWQAEIVGWRPKERG